MFWQSWQKYLIQGETTNGTFGIELQMATKSQVGFTLIELLVTVSIASVLLGMGAMSIKELFNSSSSASIQVEQVLRLARAQAIATTGAARVVTDSNRSLRILTAEACAEPPGAGWSTARNGISMLQGDASITNLIIRAGGTITNQAPSPAFSGVCFNSRGFADSDVTFQINGSRGPVEVEIMLGGAVEVRG